MAIVLLALAPLLLDALGLAVWLVYLQLPVYMLHREPQYEEHAKGAFKAAVNGMRADGREPFTDSNLLWINVGLVWGTFLVLLYGARYIDLAMGLVAPYGMLLNGLLHIRVALVRRRLNPGLWTSTLLFVPIGAGSIYVIGRIAGASAGEHLLGLGGGVALHLIVGVIVRLTLRRSAAARIGSVG